MAEAEAQIGVTGLGVMGRNLARNFARHGYTVALHNRTASRVTDTIEEFGHEGTFVPALTAEDFVQPWSGQGASSSWSTRATPPTR